MMLKLAILSLVTTLAYSISSAQINKGSTWIGGNLGYSSVHSRVSTMQEPQTSNQTVSVRPYFGKSIMNNSILGIILNYQKSKQKYTGTGARLIDDVTYGGGIFFRRYKTLGNDFYVFANGELGYNYTTREGESSVNPIEYHKSKINSIAFTIHPGLAYAISKNIHLEMRIGNLFNLSYLNEKKNINFSTGGGRDEHTRYFDVSTTFNETLNYVGVGVRYLLNAKGEEE